MYLHASERAQRASEPLFSCTRNAYDNGSLNRRTWRAYMSLRAVYLLLLSADSLDVRKSAPLSHCIVHGDPYGTESQNFQNINKNIFVSCCTAVTVALSLPLATDEASPLAKFRVYRLRDDGDMKLHKSHSACSESVCDVLNVMAYACVT
jgi:hypothetical protein